MATLADLMESARNYTGRLDWQRGKDIERIAGGDPDKAAILEQLMSLGEGGGHSVGGLAGMAKKTNIRDSAHAEQVAQRIMDLAKASGIEYGIEPSKAWGSQYLELSKPDGRMLKIRIADHQNRYGGNDVYIDPSSEGSYIEDGLAQIRGMFPEMRTKLPSGSGKQFLNNRAKQAQAYEDEIMRAAMKKEIPPSSVSDLMQSVHNTIRSAETPSLLSDAMSQFDAIMSEHRLRMR